MNETEEQGKSPFFALEFSETPGSIRSAGYAIDEFTIVSASAASSSGRHANHGSRIAIDDVSMPINNVVYFAIPAMA